MRDKRQRSKKSKSALKKITATAVFAGSLLVPSAAAANAEPKGEAIYNRVQVVREALTKSLADSEAKASDLAEELTQWGNWGNWGNWANWANWNNWNNWGNWGNWRNY